MNTKIPTLYARYKEDTQYDVGDPYLQRQVELVNDVSFHVIEEPIQRSAPVQAFIDYVTELHEQIYK